MYGLRRRIALSVATVALAASTTLGVLPQAAIAEEGDTELAAAAVDGWNRIYGADAFETMKAILNYGGYFSERGGSVIVATSDGFWDALAASGLAGVHGAPVIMTPTSSLNQNARDELVRLAPNRILVVGGAAAVSDEVVKAIGQAVPTATIRRVKGKDAADTSVSIYQEGGYSKKVAIVATSNDFYDALSIAPFAYARKAPIFLTIGAAEVEDRILPPEALTSIKEGSFEQIVIVGGRGAVPETVEEQLRDFDIVRLSGKDAIATSAAIARWELDEQGMTTEHLSVATTEGYWDALTGAALVGKQNSVLVLAKVQDGYEAIDAVYDSGKAAGIAGQIFGGKAAISNETLLYLLGQKPEPRADANDAGNGDASTERSNEGSDANSASEATDANAQG